MSRRDTFIDDAVDAGFTREQAEFMDDFLAKHPHTHEIEDVEGLEEELEGDEGR